MTRSRLHDRALLDGNGAIFMPATAENAQMLYERYGARPADPERFPWRCPETHPVQDTAQCCLVDGHVGDHRGEVCW